ncbi:MAG: hypothetical protein JWO69_59 [Thermoleophilia bacterium]|nr:hypothetical protein [Thermoleophilia bacterium]
MYGQDAVSIGIRRRNCLGARQGTVYDMVVDGFRPIRTAVARTLVTVDRRLGFEDEFRRLALDVPGVRFADVIPTSGNGRVATMSGVVKGNPDAVTSALALLAKLDRGTIPPPYRFDFDVSDLP